MLSERAGEVGSQAGELRAIAKGAGINLVGYLSIMALTLVFQFLLARTQGPSLVGIISLALSVTGIATVLALFGLHSGVLRFVALYAGQGDRARAAGAIVSAARVITVLGLVVGAALFGAADLLAVRIFRTPNLGPVLRLLALSLPLAVAMQFLLSVTQGLKRMEYRTVIECILVPTLKIGGLVVVAYVVGRSVVGVAAVLAVAFAVGAGLAAIAVWRLCPLRGRRQRPIPLTRTMLAFSWPLLLMAVVNRTWQESETLVLGAYAASDQVGIYYMCTRLTVLLTMFLFAFSDIFAPIMAELHGKDERRRLGRLFKTVTRWGFSLCLPLFLLLYTCSEQVLWLLGPGFIAGALVLQILAVSQLFNVAAGPAGWLLIMSDQPRLNLVNSLAMLGLSLGLDFVLIPRYGIIGAAIGGALSIFLINVARLVQVYVLLGIHPYSVSYLKPVAAGAVAVSGVVGLRVLRPDLAPVEQVVLYSLVLAFVYGATLVALRLDDEDRVVLDACRRWLGRLMPRSSEDR